MWLFCSYLKSDKKITYNVILIRGRNSSITRGSETCRCARLEPGLATGWPWSRGCWSACALQASCLDLPPWCLCWRRRVISVSCVPAFQAATAASTARVSWGNDEVDATTAFATVHSGSTWWKENCFQKIVISSHRKHQFWQSYKTAFNIVVLQLLSFSIPYRLR